MVRGSWTSLWKRIEKTPFRQSLELKNNKEKGDKLNNKLR